MAVQEERNGVKKPIKPSAKSYKLWQMFDEVAAYLGRQPTMDEVTNHEEMDPLVYRKTMITTQYNKWLKFYSDTDFDGSSAPSNVVSDTTLSDEDVRAVRLINEAGQFSFDALLVTPLTYFGDEEVTCIDPEVMVSKEHLSDELKDAILKADPSGHCVSDNSMKTVSREYLKTTIDHLLCSGKVHVFMTQTLSEVSEIIVGAIIGKGGGDDSK